MAEVLQASSPYDGHEFFAQSTFRRSSPSQSSLLGSSPTYPSSLQRRPSHPDLTRSHSQTNLASFASTPNLLRTSISRTSSFYSTPPSSISFDNQFEDDQEICFPSYNETPTLYTPVEFVPPASPATEESFPSPDLPGETASFNTDSPPGSPGLNTVADDTAVRDEPSRQVDYLSHDWKEEDIWLSWKHIVSKRRYYGERSRLENASWRTWAKSKYQLKTVSPETLNWLKDCDVTWLYGPLQQGHLDQQVTEPANKGSNFGQKKPILKKRSMSEVMLQKSISTSSLVKEAAAEVQAQRTSTHRGLPRRRPAMGRAQSDFTGGAAPMTLMTVGDIAISSASESSGPISPDPHSKRHIRFDDTVEQCIAVEFKQGEEEETFDWTRDSDSSDDELVMKPKARKRAATTVSRQNSFSQESKGIVMLPSTTLKYHAEDPACPGHLSAKQAANAWNAPASKMVQSDSQETLRPSRSSSNFLIEDEEDDADMSWEPSGAFSGLRRDSVAGTHASMREFSTANQDDDGEDDEDGESSSSRAGLRRTASGMFMPFEGDDEAENLNNPGFLGKVVDTVNTARDIAHVIWNVGWRK